MKLYLGQPGTSYYSILLHFTATLEECHARLPPEVDENIKKLLDAATPKVKFVKASGSGEDLGTRTGPPQGKKK